MKRLALLAVGALMLATTVFAPAAAAQQPGEVTVQSVKLGPAGSLTVTGTVQCLEGYYYSPLQVTVKQRTSGSLYNTASGQVYDQCTTNGPETFTISMFGERPFHRGPAAVVTFTSFCDPSFSCTNVEGPIEGVTIR
jgi:hypothetical protein